VKQNVVLILSPTMDVLGAVFAKPENAERMLAKAIEKAEAFNKRGRVVFLLARECEED
jgi:hypothetical protein